jgi:hypothetical protein
LPAFCCTAEVPGHAVSGRLNAANTSASCAVAQDTTVTFSAFAPELTHSPGRSLNTAAGR